MHWSFLPCMRDSDVAFQLWALSPGQLPQNFRTHSPSLSLAWHCLRNPFLAFHHWPLFQNNTFTLQKLWHFTQDSVWKCKNTLYPVDTLGWNQGNSSSGVYNKGFWFITSLGCSLTCWSMSLYWATCILHRSSKVNSLTCEISLRSPDLM